jgi:hypothetical protein
MTQFRLKACAKCGGDLALDEGDWICLQCGTYYYVGLYRHNESRLCRWPRWASSREKSAFALGRKAVLHRPIVAANLLMTHWATGVVIK